GAGVLEAVAAARLAFDRDAATAEAHAHWALDRLGVGELAGESCDGLPAALRRRVELARALVRRPAVLLLDEPAAGLTDGEKADLAALLRDLAGEGMAILLVEHDMGFLLPLAGRVLCLDRGQLIYDGPAGEVRRDQAVATAYLGRAGSA
ncbi:ATP-binding cassette domain-containing protein, partial [Azospirillum oryzae]